MAKVPYEILLRFDHENGGSYKGSHIVLWDTELGRALPPQPIFDADMPEIVKGLNTANIALIEGLTKGQQILTEQFETELNGLHAKISELTDAKK